MLKMDHKKIDSKQAGFSLIETLVALSITSLICLAVVQTYPIFASNISTSFIHYQIDRDVSRVLTNMEKDFRRIGYCIGSCKGSAITIAAAVGEAQRSCIIYSYDQDLDGKWTRTKKQRADYFAYRLRNGRLESTRGTASCHDTHGNSLFDPTLLQVDKLQYSLLQDSHLLTLDLSVRALHRANKTFDYRLVVYLRNLV